MAKNSVAVATANKDEQIAAVLVQLGEGAKKKDAEAAYEAVAKALAGLAEEGKKFTVAGLGTFDHALQSGGREIRDPKTGEATGGVTEDKHKFKFKASSSLSIPQPK